MEGKVALRTRTSTVHTVAADISDSQLGPTVFTEILVNGVPTKALADTGSPATIISLDCALNLFADQGDQQQTPEQVVQRTIGKFSPPDTSLRNYGGDPLDIVSQTRLNLTQGGCAVDTIVLVQRGARMTSCLVQMFSQNWGLPWF